VLEVLIFLAGAVASSVVTWAVAHFFPGWWRRISLSASVVVHVETDLAYLYPGDPNWITYHGVIPETIWPLGPPPTSICRDWARWLRPLGAWDEGETEVRVTLSGRSDVDIVIDGIRVICHSRTEPTGVVVRCPAGGASINVRQVEVDLDWEPGVVSYAEPDGDNLPFKKSFTLQKGETERLYVTGRSTTSAVEWSIELLLLIDGRRRIIRVDDNGKPFRTTGSSGFPSFLWSGREWSRDNVVEPEGDG
jgi:hypothetical protein